MRRGLSAHAIDRFRQRHGNRQTPVRAIQVVLESGRFQPQRPASIAIARATEDQPFGYVIAGECVFPVVKELSHEGRRPSEVLVATTCLRMPKRSKAERRALRELAREEEQWVA